MNLVPFRAPCQGMSADRRQGDGQGDVHQSVICVATRRSGGTGRALSSSGQRVGGRQVKRGLPASLTESGAGPRWFVQDEKNVRDTQHKNGVGGPTGRGERGARWASGRSLRSGGCREGQGAAEGRPGGSVAGGRRPGGAPG